MHQYLLAIWLFIAIFSSPHSFAEFQAFLSPPNCNELLKMTIIPAKKGVLAPKPLIAKIVENFWIELSYDLFTKGESEGTISWLLDPIVTMAHYQDSIEFEKPLKRYYPDKEVGRQFHDGKWSILTDNRKGFVHDALYAMSFTPTGRKLIKDTLIWAFRNTKVREKYLSLEIKDYPESSLGLYTHEFKGFTNGCALIRVSKRLNLGTAILTFAHEMSHANDYLNFNAEAIVYPLRSLVTEHQAFRTEQQIMHELIALFPTLQYFKYDKDWYPYEMDMQKFITLMIKAYKIPQEQAHLYSSLHPWKFNPIMRYSQDSSKE